jgi:hypothetical protein
VASRYLDYPGQARRLADAGAGLLEVLADPDMDRNIAVMELETASSAKQSTDLRMRFEAGAAAAVTAPSSPEDLLSAILLELQSANTLMAAGMALNEHGGGADSKHLYKTVAQVRSTSSNFESYLRLGFESRAEPSASLSDARKLFLNSGDRALDSIAGGTEGVIGSAYQQLKKMDPSKVTEAIENLGQSFQVAAATGRLLRQGLEKLKAVLNALSKIFDDKALSDIKDRVREVWQKFTADKHLVRVIIGEPAARQRLSGFSELTDVEISGFDGISRELALLDDKYQGIQKILNGLVQAVILAMGIVAALQVLGLWAAAPWVALAAGCAYGAIIGGALLAGLNYTGSQPLFGWIRGVYQIVPDPQLHGVVP